MVMSSKNASIGARALPGRRSGCVLVELADADTGTDTGTGADTTDRVGLERGSLGDDKAHDTRR